MLKNKEVQYYITQARYLKQIAQVSGNQKIAYHLSKKQIPRMKKHFTGFQGIQRKLDF